MGGPNQRALQGSYRYKICNMGDRYRNDGQARDRGGYGSYGGDRNGGGGGGSVSLSS